MDVEKSDSLTLKQFIVQYQKFENNAFVDEPGFEHLYVRYGSRYIHIDDQSIKFTNVLDIANVQALEPGSGAFTNLLHYIQHEWPEMVIYVECVLNPRFAAWLGRNEFRKVNYDGIPSFYFLPLKE